MIALALLGRALAADPADVGASVHLVFDPPRTVGLVVDDPADTGVSRDSGSELDALKDALAEQQRRIDAQQAEIQGLRAEVAAVVARRSGPAADRAGYADAVVIGPGETVDDATGFGQDVRVEGHVTGDATSFGGDVMVVDGGKVDGDATSFGGKVDVEQGASIGGDRVAFADDEEDAPSEASGVWALAEELRHRAVLLLSFAGAGVLVVGLVPKRVGQIARAIDERPLRSLVAGVVGISVLSVASLLFTLTVIGAPVAFVLVSVLGLAWLTGFVGLCQAVGDRLPFAAKAHGRWFAFALGCAMMAFASALPWIACVALIAGTVGVGASLRTRFGGI